MKTNTNENIKIFVIHYKKLVERKQHIINEFYKHGITNFEFIEIDRDELVEKDINMFEENYTRSLIAITMSHFYAYKEISKKYDTALILEDDVILSDYFLEKLNGYINELPEDYDMLFIGDGCNMHISNDKLIPGKHIYDKSIKNDGDTITRCTDSYLVNKKCATQLCDYIDNIEKKMNSPIDFWLNEPAKELQFKAYWAEPTICTQGTQCNLFHRSH